jgi:DNA-directed RNA polymerase specialized sigma24 family protein
MSLAWHAIHDNLLHFSRTLTFQRHFDLIRQTGAGLAALGDPAALLDALHRQAANPDIKNDHLKCLVRAAQGEGAETDTALTLLLLALWPGLDAIRRRSLRRRIGLPADITSEILARATEALRRLDLARVNWIAATVLKNIERDIIRDTRSEAQRQRVTSNTVPEDVVDERDASSDDLGASLLFADVEKLVGGDATLVIRVAVEGFTQAEVALELGLSEEATRKRYQRATLKLRRAHEENE